MALAYTQKTFEGLIVVVDDDNLFRGILAGNLVDAGFAVAQFSNGPEAIEFLKRDATACLVVLDWQMPEMGGLQVLKLINEAGIQVPVMFLTAHGSHAFEETALLNGAIDFVDKTRSLTILLNRISTVVMGRKGHHQPVAIAPTHEPLRCGKLELFIDSAGARWDGARVALTVAEFNIVHLLVVNGGRDVTHRAIYDTVHGTGFIAGEGENGYRTNVRTLIKRVRRKFTELDPAFDRICTYPGFGYRWLFDDEEQPVGSTPAMVPQADDLAPIMLAEKQV